MRRREPASTSGAADRLAELDVQIGFSPGRMNVAGAEEREIEEMKRQVAPEAVVDAIEESTAD